MTTQPQSKINKRRKKKRKEKKKELPQVGHTSTDTMVSIPHQLFPSFPLFPFSLFLSLPSRVWPTSLPNRNSTDYPQYENPTLKSHTAVRRAIAEAKRLLPVVDQDVGPRFLHAPAHVISLSLSSPSREPKNTSDGIEDSDAHIFE